MSAKKFKGVKKTRQESIAVGCVPPVRQPYMFWWLQLGVSTRGWVGIWGEGILGGGMYPRFSTHPLGYLLPLGYLPAQDTYPTGYLQSLVYLPPGILLMKIPPPPPLEYLLLWVVITFSLCSKSILFYNIE